MLDRRGRWAAALAGLCVPLSFAPFHWYALAPLLLAVLFLCWDGQTAREAMWRGFWFGFGAFLSGTYWLYISIHVFGRAPLIVAIVLMLGLVTLMGFYVAACGYFTARLRVPSGFMRWCLVIPAGWTLVEWARGWLISGFPWLSLGYGQIDGALRGWAPVAGLYGVSFLTALLAGVLVTLVKGNRRDKLSAIAIVVAVMIANQGLEDRQWTRAGDEDLRVGLVQGSVSQDRKWLPEQRQPTLDLYRQLTFAQQERDLVIWPEVAIPSLDVREAAYLEEIGAQARSRNMQLLLGILVAGEEPGQFYNSLLAVGIAGGVYHKRHLVPFGEYFPVPDFVRNWMRLMSLPFTDTAAGPRMQPLIRVHGVPVAVSICYEDAFGAEQLDFLPEAQILVNISNDAWFGNSTAPHQHLQMARMRALESGRYLLRTTNTGITAVISPGGAVLQQLPQFQTGVLNATILPYGGSTPYVRFGNYPVLVLCLALAIAGLWPGRARAGT